MARIYQRRGGKLESVPLEGVQGVDGKAATVAVGAVTTLPPGARATVTNSGTENAAVFDFALPQGMAGGESAVGAIRLYHSNNIPPNAIKHSKNAILPKAEYQELYEVIGDTYSYLLSDTYRNPSLAAAPAEGAEVSFRSNGDYGAGYAPWRVWMSGETASGSSGTSWCASNEVKIHWMQIDFTTPRWVRRSGIYAPQRATRPIDFQIVFTCEDGTQETVFRHPGLLAGDVYHYFDLSKTLYKRIVSARFENLSAQNYQTISRWPFWFADESPDGRDSFGVIGAPLLTQAETEKQPGQATCLVVKSSRAGSVENGTVFTPQISEDGILSWTNNGGLENPEPCNIRGSQGPAGSAGAPDASKGIDVFASLTHEGNIWGYLAPQNGLAIFALEDNTGAELSKIASKIAAPNSDGTLPTGGYWIRYESLGRQELYYTAIPVKRGQWAIVEVLNAARGVTGCHFLPEN